MKIELPGKVSFIINNLIMHGYEAYAVGGCIRDAILAKNPEDWDITTSATPEEIKRLFRHTVDTGIEHGTVTVVLDKDTYEVTTYRVDGDYKDGRHPTSVTFTSNLSEDLKRRDFTINAMAYNDNVRLVDEAGGMKDLNRHTIRCVGDPMTRFSEDYLRILRALRFSAQLNFKIEHYTREAMITLAPNLSKISAERIRVELVKLLMSDYPERLIEAQKMGITKVILPEWDAIVGVVQKNPHHSYNVEEHTLLAIKGIKKDKILRLTMLFHDMGKPQVKTTDEKGVDHFIGHGRVSAEIAKNVMLRLKFDKESIKKVMTLVAYHDYPLNVTARGVRRAMHRIGVELFPYYLAVRLADIKAQSSYKKKEKMEKLVGMRTLYHQILQENQCITLADLAIKGQDLIKMGMIPGPDIGKVLNLLLELVLDEPKYNNKEYLLSYSEKLVKENREANASVKAYREGNVMEARDEHS